MSKLEEKILQKGQAIIDEIHQSATESAKKLKENLLSEAKKDLELQLKKEQQKADALVRQAQQESERALRDEVAISKQQLIEQIFETLKEELKSLKPADHFNYVVKSLKDQKDLKNGEIRVNKKDYALYKNILTTKQGDVVEADLLNQKLGKGFKLTFSNEPAMIESGFMLVGKLYDLNFSLENLIESLAKRYEKTIYEALN